MNVRHRSLKLCFASSAALILVSVGCQGKGGVSRAYQTQLRRDLTSLVSQLESLPAGERLGFVMAHDELRGIRASGDPSLIARYELAMGDRAAAKSP